VWATLHWQQLQLHSWHFDSMPHIQIDLLGFCLGWLVDACQVEAHKLLVSFVSSDGGALNFSCH